MQSFDSGISVHDPAVWRKDAGNPHQVVLCDLCIAQSQLKTLQFFAMTPHPFCEKKMLRNKTGAWSKITFCFLFHEAPANTFPKVTQLKNTKARGVPSGLASDSTLKSNLPISSFSFSPLFSSLWLFSFCVLPFYSSSLKGFICDEL